MNYRGYILPNLSRKTIGTCLILLSFIGFTYLYAPFFSLFFIKPVTVTKTKEFTITIPKINAKASVIKNVNPWQQDIYTKALEKGVAHAQETALPGEKGTIFLFAHSSEVPWRITRYNTAFFRLSELKKNDSIFLTKDEKIYKYKVSGTKIVSPSAINYLFEGKNQLILQTCYPTGTDFQRLLIFADPV